MENENSQFVQNRLKTLKITKIITHRNVIETVLLCIEYKDIHEINSNKYAIYRDCGSVPSFS